MQISKTDALRLKAILMSNDGGRTWAVVQQFYLEDLGTTLLMDETFRGIVLIQKDKEKKNGHE